MTVSDHHLFGQLPSTPAIKRQAIHYAERIAGKEGFVRIGEIGDPLCVK